MGPASSSERHVPPEPPPAEPIPEALLKSPDYEIVRELSRGGMGVVYLVRNRRMDRLECLKVVNAELLKRPGFRERFEREMRSAARVNHPHIVTAFSSPTLEGLLAFAMEYVHGVDLARLVAGHGPLPVSNACYYVYQAAKALQCAHEKALVHRDIKPGNLMLARDGHRETIKVLDFGLAKATSESPTDGALTEKGEMLGTPQFMAPEQIKDAASADIRADIYSLGCTLYFLLTGAAPFQDKSGLYELLHAQQFESARLLNEVRPEVPPELAGVVAKMTAKDPQHRYQQPDDVAQALAVFFKEGVEDLLTGRDLDKTVVPAPSVAMRKAETEVSVKHRQAQAPGATPLHVAPSPGVVPTMVDEGAARPVPAPINRLNSPAGPPSHRKQPRRIWGRLAALIALAAAAALWWTGIIDVKARYGTLVLEVNEPKADVYIDGAETEVTWDDSGKKAEVKVKTGNRRVEVSKDGYNVAAKEMEFKEGESQTFKARLMPMPTLASTGSGASAAASGTNPAESSANVPATVSPAAAFDGRTPGQERDDNGLKISLVWCAAGEFTMGSPHGEKDRGTDEEPVHVKLTRGFWLSKNEVTQAQWSRLMATTPWKGETNVQEGPDFPATFINWEEAVAFCGKLTAEELAAGRLPKGCEYSLPTEAQWEYACRAGTNTAFSFGEDATPLREFGWFKTNTIDAGEKFAHAVNQKKPNRWGMHDMHGNVFEWCRDVFVVKLPGGTDPVVGSGGLQHVYRGGGWFNTPQYCRSAIRRGLDPSFRGNALGIRVACIQAGGG